MSDLSPPREDDLRGGSYSLRFSNDFHNLHKTELLDYCIITKNSGLMYYFGI